MRLAPILVGVCCLVGAACAKTTPSFPAAGLRIYSDGRLLSTGGFYQEESPSTAPKIIVTIREMKVTADGHQVAIQWRSQYSRTADTYEFTFNVDGATTRKTVQYSGSPIVLLDEPFRVVLQDLRR